MLDINLPNVITVMIIALVGIVALRFGLKAAGIKAPV